MNKVDSAAPNLGGGASTQASGTHTPEPWAIETLGSTLRIVNAGGDDLFIIGDCHNPENYANARRIVACVNALVGYETEALERVAVEQLHQNLIEQRDELAAVLREMLKHRDEVGCADYPAITRARLALAKLGTPSEAEAQ